VCTREDFTQLELDDEHASYVRLELDLWHKYYLPIGKTVLDIGAGNGETAFFYLHHGAEHVICIEPNSELLYRNFGRDPRVTIIPLAVDSIKSDCEGAELGAVIETHFFTRMKMVKRIAGQVQLWKVVRPNWTHWIRDYPQYSFHKRKVWIAHWVRVHLLGPRR
jgi:SAM-dependent methyltransferase